MDGAQIEKPRYAVGLSIAKGQGVKRREVLVGTVSAATVASAATVGTGAASAQPVSRPSLNRKAASSSVHETRELLDMTIIQNLLAGSALSADVGDSAYQTALYAEDAVMDVGGSAGEIRGREAIVSIITDPSHAKLRAEGMAHVAAQPQIKVDGDRAVAVGYLQIMALDKSGIESSPAGMPSSGKWVTWRLSANRWEFERRSGRWQITRRTIRAAPSSEALELLRLA